jgi:hypothetical protein
MRCRATVPGAARCSRRGCKEQALWRPFLVLFVDTGAAAQLMLRLPIQLCDQHRGRGAMTEVLSATGVDRLRSALRGIDFPSVDWDRSFVRFAMIH